MCAAALFASAASAAAPLSWGTPVQSDGSNHQTAVACASTSMCVAVDTLGNVTSTTTPASGGWTGPSMIDSGHQLASIACPSTALCFAVDDNGSLYFSSSPTTGSWQHGSIDGTTALTAISCPSTGLCVAVDAAGGVRSSSTPTTTATWGGSTIDGTNRLTGLSCPTTSFCAAVDSVGHVLVTATPTSNWGQPLTLNGASGGLTAISCTSAAVCVAVAANGNVYASANASSGTPTWSQTPVDVPTQLNAVSCSEAGACVLGDQLGNAISSDTPAGAAPNWSITTVDAGRAINGISCLATGLCLAVDGSGQAVAGTFPAPTVTTGSASVASQVAAALTATVNPNDATLTDCHFDYGTTAAYGTSVPCATVPSANGGAQAVSAQLSGLSAATTYHFRIVAANGVASSAGADGTFTTPVPLKASPSLSGTPAIGSTLTCKSNVTTTTGETVTYQWLSNTVAIAGATAATYTVVAADAGHHISCQVTITGDGGSATGTSGFASIPSNVLGKVLETFTGPGKHGATSASVPVTCSPQADGNCKITLKLTTVQTVKHKLKTTVVGSSTAIIAPGAKRTLKVSLNAAGRRLLASRGSLAVRLTVHGTVLGKLTATLATDKFSFGVAKRTKTKARATHAPRQAR